MPCETLAKLDHDLTNDPDSPLAAALRPGRLVVIDEAGMADTLTLERVVAYAVGRGAVVRLIGDDQQLAAIGAGGVLRDIARTHGAVRLDELVRFADPTEAAASTDLREGDAAALGFYLDHDRIHIGDAATCTDQVFDAWTRDRAAGQDCLMLAPTRELVRELNLRGQAAQAGDGPSARLSDECAAYVGDTVITRRNDRRLATSGTDWVKNGDRWIVSGVHDGALTVRHRDTGLRATLPATYVEEHVELGWASTVHTAQGLTADVVHGIVTGTESRQTLYTMLTRGRAENHVHVALPDPAEDHLMPTPALDHAATATELLEGIVSRDGAAVSATTIREVASSPEIQLHDAATATQTRWSWRRPGRAAISTALPPARSPGSPGSPTTSASTPHGGRTWPPECDASSHWWPRSARGPARRCRGGPVGTRTCSPPTSAPRSPCGVPQPASGPTTAPSPARRRTTTARRRTTASCADELTRTTVRR
jgi:hypothetical protein